MEIKDLRLGNWINVNPRLSDDFEIPKPIAQINEHIFQAILMFKTVRKSISPIILATDWLIKLGFEQHGNHFTHTGQLSHIKVFPPGSPNKAYGIFVEGRLIGDVAYVHKLQNFWFEVMHEELRAS